jgi:hypothetical protein
MFIVGFVNYKTSIYMETQLQTYKRFAGEKFQIVVLENSKNQEETDTLIEIIKKNGVPVKLIKGITTNYCSFAHGEGLQQIYELIIKEYPDVPYFLTQDPDFFWVQPNFLSFLKDKLSQFTTVGAPYHDQGATGGGGHPWFPAAFGAAYKLDVMKRKDINFRASDERYPNGRMHDVGWQVRENLQEEPYFYFDQMRTKLPFGSYSTEPFVHRYSVDDHIVAYHLHGGSLEMDWKKMRQWFKRDRYKQRLIDAKAPPEWQENRKKICEFMWQEINKST